MRKTILIRLATAALVALPAMPAMAQEAAEAEESGPIDVEFTLDLVTDYRFRGVSLSDKKPAVQPGVTISHESGFYVGAWGSNVAENPGSDIELDILAGFSGGDDKFNYDLGGVYYLYPGASSGNYAELIGKVGTTVGPATVGAIIGYAPKQDNIGGVDNVYIGANAEMPLGKSPITLAGSVGLEDGAFGDNKIDWSLGANASLNDNISVGVAYVDTNRNMAGLSTATVVGSLKMAF